MEGGTPEPRQFVPHLHLVTFTDAGAVLSLPEPLPPSATAPIAPAARKGGEESVAALDAALAQDQALVDALAQRISATDISFL